MIHYLEARNIIPVIWTPVPFTIHIGLPFWLWIIFTRKTIVFWVLSQRQLKAFVAAVVTSIELFEDKKSRALRAELSEVSLVECLRQFVLSSCIVHFWPVLSCSFIDISKCRVPCLKSALLSRRKVKTLLLYYPCHFKIASFRPF